MAGVFMHRGMTVGASQITFDIDENGQRHGELQLEIHFDVCPTWIGLACSHLKAAREAREIRVIVWAEDDEQRKAEINKASLLKLVASMGSPRERDGRTETCSL